MTAAEEASEAANTAEKSFMSNMNKWDRLKYARGRQSRDTQHKREYQKIQDDIDRVKQQAFNYVQASRAQKQAGLDAQAVARAEAEAYANKQGLKGQTTSYDKLTSQQKVMYNTMRSLQTQIYQGRDSMTPAKLAALEKELATVTAEYQASAN